jgi:hypothetical protein
LAESEPPDYSCVIEGEFEELSLTVAVVKMGQLTLEMSAMSKRFI